MNKLIKDLDASERPREKVLDGRIKELSNAELMALLFATGIKGKSVIELSDEILRDNANHLSLVTKYTPQELSAKYPGIGPAKAVTLLAALELGARSVADAQALNTPVVTSSESAYKMMKPHFIGLKHEEFWVLFINRAGHEIRRERISQGGTTATVVDIKIILRKAIQCLASGMLLFHNHPSGQLRPSGEDDSLTRRIAEGAKIIDVRVYDHIIATDAGYYSYNDHGKL
ncbi:MAG: DNA repair protein RadC [Clostridium sp.]|nr:DNA repair protein RadC [Clostridium sp.]